MLIIPRLVKKKLAMSVVVSTCGSMGMPCARYSKSSSSEKLSSSTTGGLLTLGSGLGGVGNNPIWKSYFHYDQEAGQDFDHYCLVLHMFLLHVCLGC